MSERKGKGILYLKSTQKLLKRRQAQITEESNITVKRIMLEEVCIAYSDLKDLFDEDGNTLPPHELPERIRRAIRSIEIKELPKKRQSDPTTYEYKYKLWDKGKALERISKHLGLYERDNIQKAAKIFIMRPDDDDAPQIEDKPEFVEAEFKQIKGDKPIALIE
jgi:phage terminase small subunit